jgi:hypothetical protein
MRPAQEALHDSAVDVVEAELPQVGAVVDHLGERVPEVGVLRPRLELDEHEVSR